MLLSFQAILQPTGTQFLDYLVAALDPGYISGPYFAAFFKCLVTKYANSENKNVSNILSLNET